MKKTFLSMLAVFVLGSTQAIAESIWKAEQGHEIYLFGTIHMLRATDYPLPPVYDHTFEQCDRLWLETDMDALEDPQVALQLQSDMSLPAGEMLDAHLSTETFQALKAEADKQGIPMAMLMPLKPWAASLVLSMTAIQQQGFDPRYGLDVHLSNKAMQESMPVVYLETAMEQFGYLERAGTVAPEKFVKQTLDELARIDQLTLEMVQAWKAGDQEHLLSLMGLEEYPEVADVLLDERNARWVERLLDEGTAETTDCIAVGTLHMAGDSGLVRQLRAAGYAVTHLSQ